MIYSTATVPVNPDNENKLTRAQAWASLVLKARDARLFLPRGVCTRCEVVEDSGTHFVREATILGEDLREIITLEQQNKVTFFQATGPREGAIVNELFEDESGALQLRFEASVDELDEMYSLVEALMDGTRSRRRFDQLTGMRATLCTSIDGF